VIVQRVAVALRRILAQLAALLLPVEPLGRVLADGLVRPADGLVAVFLADKFGAAGASFGDPRARYSCGFPGRGKAHGKRSDALARAAIAENTTEASGVLRGYRWRGGAQSTAPLLIGLVCPSSARLSPR
jgi:hypothetical protein